MFSPPAHETGSELRKRELKMTDYLFTKTEFAITQVWNIAIAKNDSSSIRIVKICKNVLGAKSDPQMKDLVEEICRSASEQDLRESVGIGEDGWSGTTHQRQATHVKPHTKGKTDDC